MASFHVQRVNDEAKPPRFEWLSSEPVFDDKTDLVTQIEWTADPGKAFDLGPEKAGHWAQLIEGGSFVRFGDAEPAENQDFGEAERARAQKAREEHGTKLREEKRAAAVESSTLDREVR